MENSVSMTTVERETESITGRLVWKALSVESESELRVSLNLYTTYVCTVETLCKALLWELIFMSSPRRFSQFRGHLMHTQYYTGTQKSLCYRDSLNSEVCNREVPLMGVHCICLY